MTVWCGSMRPPRGTWVCLIPMPHCWTCISASHLAFPQWPMPDKTQHLAWLRSSGHFLIKIEGVTWFFLYLLSSLFLLNPCCRPSLPLLSLLQVPPPLPRCSSFPSSSKFIWEMQSIQHGLLYILPNNTR